MKNIKKITIYFIKLSQFKIGIFFDNKIFFFTFSIVFYNFLKLSFASINLRIIFVFLYLIFALFINGIKKGFIRNFIGAIAVGLFLACEHYIHLDIKINIHFIKDLIDSNPIFSNGTVEVFKSFITNQNVKDSNINYFLGFNSLKLIFLYQIILYFKGVFNKFQLIWIFIFLSILWGINGTLTSSDFKNLFIIVFSYSALLLGKKKNNLYLITLITGIYLLFFNSTKDSSGALLSYLFLICARIISPRLSKKLTLVPKYFRFTIALSLSVVMILVIFNYLFNINILEVFMGNIIYSNVYPLIFALSTLYFIITILNLGFLVGLMNWIFINFNNLLKILDKIYELSTNSTKIALIVTVVFIGSLLLLKKIDKSWQKLKKSNILLKIN